MRIIDADALKERLKEYCVDGDSEATKWYEMMGIDEEIDDAPTVDAEPVNHGKWVRLTRGWYCSSCRKLVFPKTMESGTDYCPYCGAKMDEEENENENN